MNVRSSEEAPNFWPVRIVGAAALVLLLYLLLQKWVGNISSIAGCGGEGGCDQVMGGPWSEWFYVPVTALAAMIHAGILFLTLPSVQARLGRAGDQLLAAGGVILAGAAVYFISILYLVEKRLCPWCLGLHLAGLAEAALLLRQAVRVRQAGTRGILEAAGLTGMAAIAVLAAGQIWGPKPKTYVLTQESIAASGPAASATAAKSGASREVSFFKDALKFDAASLPILGDPSARVVLVEFFDYTCRSCRNLNGDLSALKKKYPGAISVIVLPAPLNRSCNPDLKLTITDHPGACELARLGLAMWKASPENFAVYHQLLMSLPLPISSQQVEVVRRKALELAGAAAFEKAEADPWVEQRLKESLEVYAKLTTQNIKMPKLLLHTDTVMHGTVGSTEEFVRQMEQQFDLAGTGAPLISAPR